MTGRLSMPTDDFYLRNGMNFWPHGFKAPRRFPDVSRDIEAVRRIAEIVEKWPADEQPTNATFEEWMFATTWVDRGCPKLVTSHKYAAALMCTRTVGADVHDAVVPWDTFIVVVPEGLLVPEGSDVSYDRIRVDCRPDPLHPNTPQAAYMRLYDVALKNHAVQNQLSSPKDLLAPDEVICCPGIEEQSKVDLLARRLVAGLLLSVQHTDNFRAPRIQQSRAVVEHREPPDHRTIFVGKPMSVDCRPAVAAFLRGARRGGPPSVQTIVRGHYKRQVLGIGRISRKVIWVEPYWRGPEDAPILARPYRVGDDRGKVPGISRANGGSQ